MSLPCPNDVNNEFGAPPLTFPLENWATWIGGNVICVEDPGPRLGHASNHMPFSGGFSEDAPSETAIPAGPPGPAGSRQRPRSRGGARNHRFRLVLDQFCLMVSVTAGQTFGLADTRPGCRILDTFKGLSARHDVLRREHDNQGVRFLILSQISSKRTGGPALSLKPLKALCRPTETRITPLRGKGGMLNSIGKLQHKWRPGSPAWCAEVFESVVQANRNQDRAVTGEGRDVQFDW